MLLIKESAKIVIDRLDRQAGIVVLEIDGTMVSASDTIIPDEAKEGDILSLVVNKEETEKNKNNIKSRFESLFD